MKPHLILAINFILIPFFIISGQTLPLEKGLNSININVLQAQLGFLSSDWMEGRMAGEKGEALAAEYIASILQLYGVKPLGDQAGTYLPGKVNEARSYFQKFNLLKISQGDEQEMKLVTLSGSSKETVDFTYNIDYILRPSTKGFDIEKAVTFAGYGFINEKLNFNNIKDIDLKGKLLLAIAGAPAFASKSLSPDEISASIKEFELAARKAGAAGIMEFDPAKNTVSNPAPASFENMAPSEKAPRSGTYNFRYEIPGNQAVENFILLKISSKTANEIIKGTGNNIPDYVKKADLNEPYNISAVTGKNVCLKSSVKVSLMNVRNIIGVIEGNKKDEIIVLGAHYDHIGMNDGYIWNGADDNGSGSVGVMTIAKAIMETDSKPDKTIIIALWTAEEEGLLGSEYYLKNLDYPLKNIKLNVNFDMISRYISDDQPNKVTMTYTSSCTNFKNITRTNLSKAKIDLDIDYQPSVDPPGGTDHRNFVKAGIPVMRFKPGHREEYHTPYDETGTLDWDIMEKIVRISFADVWELANTEW